MSWTDQLKSHNVTKTEDKTVDKRQSVEFIPPKKQTKNNNKKQSLQQ